MSQQSDHIRRIAIILGPGSGSRYLLDQLHPLLAADRDIEIQGVFLEEAGVQHAAELPFVKELCRITFAVREFDSEQFERTLALRMRSARRALSVLADHSGAALSFRNVRGSAVGLLLETLRDADLTLFEPARPRVAAAITPPGRSGHKPWIAALVRDVESARVVLSAAVQLAGGDMDRIAVLLKPASGTDGDELRSSFRAFLPGTPGHVRSIAQGDLGDMALSVRELLAAMLVVPAMVETIDEKDLQFLLGQIRCPVCLVRDWGE